MKYLIFSLLFLAQLAVAENLEYTVEGISLNMTLSEVKDKFSIKDEGYLKSRLVIPLNPKKTKELISSIEVESGDDYETLSLVKYELGTIGKRSTGAPYYVQRPTCKEVLAELTNSYGKPQEVRNVGEVYTESRVGHYWKSGVTEMSLGCDLGDNKVLFAAQIILRRKEAE